MTAQTYLEPTETEIETEALYDLYDAFSEGNVTEVKRLLSNLPNFSLDYANPGLLYEAIHQGVPWMVEALLRDNYDKRRQGGG